MATLTIRRLDDEVVDKLKYIAKEHNRSAEAEVRSILEDYTAGLLVQREIETTGFYAQLREFMKHEGIEGFTEDEFHIPDRAADVQRPPIDLDDRP